MKSSNDSWTRCSGGEVSGLVGLLEQKRQGRVTRRRIVSVAGLVLLAGFFLTPGGFASADASQQTASCHDVHQHTENFVAGTLDASLKERIQAHLEHCPGCVRHLDQARTKAEVVNIKSESSVASL